MHDEGWPYLELGVDNLDDDLLVGEPDNEPVLGRVVLVLGLGDKTLSGVVWKQRQQPVSDRPRAVESLIFSAWTYSRSFPPSFVGT